MHLINEVYTNMQVTIYISIYEVYITRVIV